MGYYQSHSPYGDKTQSKRPIFSAAGLAYHYYNQHQDTVAKRNASKLSAQEWADEVATRNALNVQDDQGRERLLAEGAQRQGALDSLDRAYNDPSRAASRERYYSDSIDQMMAQLSQQHGVRVSQNGYDAVKRGVLGGSNDMEHQASLSNDLQQATTSGTQAAYQGLTEANQADRRQYSDLRNQIMAGDPQSAAAYGIQAQGEASAANRAQTGVNFSDAYARLGQQQSNNNSQVLGAVGNSAAQAVSSYSGAQNQPYRPYSSGENYSGSY